MNPLTLILTSTFFISLGSIVGVATLSLKKILLEKILLFLVSFSAGTLIGGAFLHLLPEAAEQLNPTALFGTTLISFIIFLLLEKIFRWRHCHKEQCDIHSFGYMNLIGDAIHNFLDGLVLAAAFLADTNLGIITALVIASHEIPQEIGDFGVLVYAGFQKRTALIANFATAQTIILGGITGYFLAQKTEEIIPYLLPLAAGGFIYIAASDLIPEVRKEKHLPKSLIHFLAFLTGIFMLFLIKVAGNSYAI